MPPRVVGPPRKEACIIIIDVGASMAVVHDEATGKSGLDNAMDAVKLMIQQKLLFTKQDELGLVLVGTDETNNELAAEADDDSSYQHVSVLTPLQKPDLKMLESINSIEASSCRRGDCIDAILVAMQLLHARVGKKRFQKRIFLVTDAAAPIVDDPAAMEAIADGMRRDEFKLNIIGVGFKEDDEEEDEEEGRAAKKEEGDVADMEDEEKKHGDDVKPAAAAAAAAGGGGARVKKESLRTATQCANESLLKRFVSSVDGTVFNANSAIEMLSVFRSRSVQQVTKFRGQLHLSSSCAISVWAYTKTQVMNMPTLKKTSKLAGGASAAAASSEFGGGEDEEGGGAAAAAAGGGGWRGGGGDDDDDGGDGFAAAGGGDGKIAMERSYFNRLGEREKEVSADMRIKSYRYGREQIPFSEEDVEQLKLKTEKGIYILSFTPQKAIPRHHYMGGVDCIVAEPGDFGAALALSALIHALYDTAKVAVVRFVKKMNDRPLLGILIPVVKADVEAFYFNQLPFEEDIRDFAGLDDVKVSANQKEAAEALVRSMNLMSAVPSNGGDGDEDEEPTESLVPKHTFNPALQRFYQCVERRALDPSADIVGEGLDPAIQRYLVPLPSVLRQAAPKLAAFKSAFDLRPVEETDKKAKKRHWKDWYSEELRDSDVAEMRKRARGFEEGGGGAAAAAAGGASATPSVSQTPGAPFSLDAAVADTVDHVGPIRPVADFHAMLARRDEAGIEVRAMDELAARIKDALVNSFAGSEYPRAFDGLQALRAACVRFEESERFNTLLAWLKKECAPTPEQPKKKHAEFFARMHAAMVLPIHSGEVPAAPLAQEEAQKFYEADVDMPAPPAAAAAAPQNEDDLFDSME